MDIDFKPLFYLAFFGLACACVVLGAGVGFALATPFALWSHSVDVYTPALAIGAAGGLSIFGMWWWASNR